MREDQESNELTYPEENTRFFHNSPDSVGALSTVRCLQLIPSTSKEPVIGAGCPLLQWGKREFLWLLPHITLYNSINIK